MHRLLRSLAPALLVASLPACSSEQRLLHLEVTTGHETDTFSMDPPVTRILISAESPDGTTAVIASTTPGGSFDLGDIVETQSVGFDVSGFDALGRLVVQGRTLGAISLLSTGTENTLPVFVQRIGQWARPPGALTRAHVNAPAGILAEQFVWQTGGDAFGATGKVKPNETDFYDLFAMGGAIGPTLGRSAETIVSRGSAAMVFDAAGGTSVDFASDSVTEFTKPTGLASFGDIAGGRPVYDDAGGAFVVGGTRASGAPSQAVLIIERDGTLSAAMLHHARRGAAAAWVPNVGLVVAGGSDSGEGVEVLPLGAKSFVVAGYPIDPVVGAAAVLHPTEGDALKVLLIGGTNAGKGAPTRLLDLKCSTACLVGEVPGLALPADLARVSGYVMTDTQMIVVGDEEVSTLPGETRAFVLDLAAGTVAEAPLRERRAGAGVTPSPLGTLAILGGLHLDGTPALVMETFFPP